MGCEKIITVRNQGTIRVKVEKDGIVFDVLSGNGAVRMMLQPNDLVELVAAGDVALCYFDTRKDQIGTTGKVR